MSLTISPSLTAADREKSGGAANHEQSTNVRGDSALSRMAPKHIETRDGEKLSPAYKVHYCADCQRQRAEYSAWKRARSMSLGLCRRCHKNKPKPGNSECVPCLAKKQVNYLATHKSRWGLQRKSKLDGCRSLDGFIRRRMIAGLCVRCGCPKSNLKRKYCLTCYEIERHMAAFARARKRKLYLRQTSVVDGFQYLYGDRADTKHCKSSMREFATMNHAYDNEAAA